MNFLPALSSSVHVSICGPGASTRQAAVWKCLSRYWWYCRQQFLSRWHCQCIFLNIFHDDEIGGNLLCWMSTKELVYYQSRHYSANKSYYSTNKLIRIYQIVVLVPSQTDSPSFTGRSGLIAENGSDGCTDNRSVVCGLRAGVTWR